jgi:hypothetical protein
VRHRFIQSHFGQLTGAIFVDRVEKLKSRHAVSAIMDVKRKYTQRWLPDIGNCGSAGVSQAAGADKADAKDSLMQIVAVT